MRSIPDKTTRANSLASTLAVHISMIALSVVSSIVKPAMASGPKPLAEYRALNRAQGMRALGYAEMAAASQLCPSFKGEILRLRQDLLQFYEVPAQSSLRDATTRVLNSKGAAEAVEDMRKPSRYCDSLDEVLAVWRSYTLRPDTIYP